MRAVPFLLVVFLTTFFAGHADPYPDDYFRSPIGIPISLSGSFGEMRSNHFHTGLDIRTRSSVGYRVYAVADGYVSRIGVSPYGYGRALYIDHPNGYTSGYMHLLEFNDEIEAYVRRKQYEAEDFSVQLYPEPGQLPVRKGDVVAHSGNSGSSMGPHLHFEIRDTESEWPINPLLFGIPLSDRIPPQVRKLKVYAADSNSFAVVHRPNGRSDVVTMTDPAVLDVTGSNGTYRLVDGQRIEAHGRIGFGIEQRDLHNGSNYRLGAYRIDLFAGDRLLHGFNVEKLNFALQRYMNAHIDYEERIRNRRYIQRSFRLPGNVLPYYTQEGDGWLDVEPGGSHTMEYRLSDVPGNTTRFRFTVSGIDGDRAERPRRIDYATLVPYNHPHVYTTDGISLIFPAGTFYDDLPLVYRNLGAARDGYSDVHQVQDRYTPVHQPYQISIRAGRLPDDLSDKALIALLDDDGDASAVGGRFEDGYVTTETRTLGRFFVATDTTAPSIAPVNISNGKNMSGQSKIQIRIRDDFSGIDSFEGRVDGQWILFEYDPKRRMLEYTFDEHVPAGSHELVLVVRDNVGNEAAYTASFRR